ncbi:MAG TPA: acyl-ACP desaturase [Acidimicrobiia bacterium]|jgi:acyl-[acyl-carrier-protein] desaturase
MPYNEELELLEAVEGDVARLAAEHQERRSHWYFHDIVPWERGRSFRDQPWDESQCTINERARTSLVLNLLTEDNLPWYHLALERYLPEGSVWKDWNGTWTSEEAQHAMAIRSYLLTTRNCDPRELEDDRMATMKAGWEPNFGSPSELFAYTSAQELATRVSHRNAGKITEDEAAFELMRNIAADENHHFVFYKGVMAAMLREAPSVAIEGIISTFSNFQMPGVGIPGFVRRSIDVAKAGVYNLRIHHDRVVVPLLEQWNIAGLKDLTPKASEIQERLMALPASILAAAERFEARYGAVVA